MLGNLVQQFAGSGHENMSDSELHGGVSQMLQSAPSEHSVGAFGEALSALGAGGFGQSVQQGAMNASPEQRSGLGAMLMNAVSQRGGSPSNVLSQLEIGGGSCSSLYPRGTFTSIQRTTVKSRLVKHAASPHHQR